MDFLNTILWPFKWLVSAILWVFHEAFTAIGMDPANGWTWTLAVIGLVIVIRALLIPVFFYQIKAQRGMQAMQPDILKLQAKYKGKTDQVSRQRMAEEQMALYKEHGTNPFAACLPLLIQMPFFFALFNVLSSVSKSRDAGEGIQMLTADQVRQFDESKIFDAFLSSALLHPQEGDNHLSVIILSILMIAAMIITQFVTQKQIMSKNMTEEALNSPFMRQQQMLLYVLPVVFGIGGINFPIALLIYWTVTNLWTLGQQWYVIRRMPTPGSQAAKDLAARRAAKGLPEKVLLGTPKSRTEAADADVLAPKPVRNQPVRRNRRKK
ncbi:membrane protein insertase YidC [Falsarthrobacter nasiphocae]|uniref:Membrane protein insertase YidC n=1 Tax=Falsarthrobacter nasiphocae TaxID=189863 RepID=A0AAE3YGX7_9MICC|nr:membrane protein insertase YidC [Falsarthrobacter nasiphocae]MDR6892077.1 YidC/Oxa1 family membrane protein insertase [Falsarthrobacter nasiphocae]